MDKGYQGAQHDVWAIIPKKKPCGKLLSVDDEHWNEAVSSECIIVDNFLVISQSCGVLFRPNTDGVKKVIMISFALCGID